MRERICEWNEYIEAIIHERCRELGRPLNTWASRMDAIIAGAFDYDDAIDVVQRCATLADIAEMSALYSMSGDAPPQVGKWEAETEPAFEALCASHDPQNAPERYTLEKCARLADALDLLWQDATFIRPQTVAS